MYSSDLVYALFLPHVARAEPNSDLCEKPDKEAHSRILKGNSSQGSAAFRPILFDKYHKHVARCL